MAHWVKVPHCGAQMSPTVSSSNCGRQLRSAMRSTDAGVWEGSGSKGSASDRSPATRTGRSGAHGRYHSITVSVCAPLSWQYTVHGLQMTHSSSDKNMA